ncbi:acyl-CoA carboxylase epsilon subunit [Amnibacterium flavum]|uniref:Acyl-CoA carboxylase subunit epsilon n=1 Tax=Amnibacterium flavum TaxID=2173173 RepID=A0A2V1HTE0_9MICO|nr:acyl-CoA carboxylase epsilon subunit [Amnibacterium flavum]PVZ95833.1 acyl-CoA carboxylase subunit epsilon [Amnibacterium flavum]
MTDENAVRVVSGNPTDEELAAVVAVLTAAADERPAAEPAATVEPNAWAKSQRSLRSWDQSKRWG